MTEPTSEQSMQFIKLVTGDGIIAHIQSAGDEWLISKPLQVFVDKSRGQTELVITPWLPTSSTDAKEVRIIKQHVLFHVPVIPSISEYMTRYAEQFYSEQQPVTTYQDVTGKDSKKFSKEDVMNLLSNIPTGKKN